MNWEEHRKLNVKLERSQNRNDGILCHHTQILCCVGCLITYSNWFRRILGQGGEPEGPRSSLIELQTPLCWCWEEISILWSCFRQWGALDWDSETFKNINRLFCKRWSNISMCFLRDGDRAGHTSGPAEPGFGSKLHGPLHEAGGPLAQAGRSEGKVTNASPRGDRKPFQALLTALTYFTSVCLPHPDASLRLHFDAKLWVPAVSAYFTWILSHQRAESLCVFLPSPVKMEFPQQGNNPFPLFWLSNVRVSLSLSHYINYIWLNLHSSCSIGRFKVPCCSSTEWCHRVISWSGLYLGATLTKFRWEHSAGLWRRGPLTHSCASVLPCVYLLALLSCLSLLLYLVIYCYWLIFHMKCLLGPEFKNKQTLKALKVPH